jgi:plasmid maintenance system antidote protein VapI
MATTLSAQLLKYLRKHDISQKVVAKYLELSPSFLSEVLAGKKNFSPLSAMRLSQMLEKKSMKTEKADASAWR